MLTLASVLAAMAWGCDSSTPVPAGDAAVFDPCPTVPVAGGDCAYHGYGSTCSVPCNFASTCTYEVAVQWVNGYCCGAGAESYTGCRCVGGEAICDVFLSGATRAAPTTTCELCSADAGTP